jgi:uncharacterized surface protein with fasciclin (FAS1) repeats
MNPVVLKAIALSTILASTAFGAFNNAQAHHTTSHINIVASLEEMQHSKLAAKKTIVETAKKTPELSSLVKAVIATDLAGTLSSKGPFTVFAPDNNAFAKAPKINTTQLKNILTYHVVSGSLSAAELYNGQNLTTVNGQKLKVIKFRNGTIKIKSSSGNIVTITAANINNKNGIVHVINNILIPSKF